MIVTWDQALEIIHERAHAAASNICVELFHDITKSISTEGPPRSEPGNPPNVDTGNLISNFTLDGSEDALAYQITSPDEYSIYLEFGTDRMEPRPYLHPAFLRAAENGEDWAKEGVEKSPASLPIHWNGS